MPTFTPEFADAILAEVKSVFDGGLIYVFAGPVPSSSDTALNMVDDHTELCVISVGDTGTGITFAAPSGGVLSKNPSEEWEGLVDFDGAEAAETSLAPTFYRLCTSGDNGRGAASNPRIQGGCGGPTSSAPVKFDTDTFTDNGTNKKGIGIFTIPVEVV